MRGHVQQNDVPFIEDDMGEGERVLPGDNPIYHEEFEVGDPRVSENRTRPRHILHPLDPNAPPGTVTHEVYVDEHGMLRYDVIGQGARGRASPDESNLIGVVIFRPGVQGAVDRFGDPPNVVNRTPVNLPWPLTSP